MSILVRRLLAAALLLCTALPAHARLGGIVGRADLGCMDFQCHASSTVAAPTVRIEGPTQVDPGSQTAYRVVVVRNDPNQTAAGFNLAASDGELLAGDDPDVRVEENRESGRDELTHRQPRESDANGESAWTVIWRAPATAGAAVLFAAGNSVNLDFTNEGDVDALAVLPVQVGAAATPTPTATPPPACAGDCNGDGTVAINELILGVNIALGAPAAGCPPIDANGDGEVAINELIAAVGRALSGC